MTRELDRRVAEKLGWKQIETHGGSATLWGVFPPLRGWSPLPEWSTDMNAAMELWQRQWVLQILPWGIRPIWKCAQSEAPTPTEAICLAFLGEKK